MSQKLPNRRTAIYLKGFLMGIADVIPGVSGGTIAFITGIYEELVNTIHNLNLGFFKVLRNQGFIPAWNTYNLTFLLLLVLGIASSFILLARLVAFLLENYPVLIYAFIFGLVTFSAILVGKQISRWNVVHVLSLLVFIGIGYWITILEPAHAPDSYWYLFFSGAIAIIAMILPGISGSFILILLGSYPVFLDIINDLSSSISGLDGEVFFPSLIQLLVFVAGLLVGIKSFSGVLTWLFRKYKDLTLAILTGLMIGAMNKIWPWKQTLTTYINSKGEEVPLLEKSVLPTDYLGDPQLLPAILLAVTGFMILYLIEKIALQKGKQA